MLATELVSGFLDERNPAGEPPEPTESSEPPNPRESARTRPTPRPTALAASVTTRWFTARFEVARAEPE
jgi:hypothetical protein